MPNMGTIDSETYADYIKAITDITHSITSGRPLDDIFNRVVMITAGKMRYEVCSIWMVDDSVRPKVLRLKATQALDPEYARPRTMGRVEGVAGFVATHNQVLKIPDVQKEPRYKDKEIARKLGLVSLLSVPLKIRDDDVLGVLNVFTNKPRDFDPIEVHQVTTIGNLTALAVHCAELEGRVSGIQEELENRKVIERAKEVLIRRKNMAGDQAFRWIQKRSMDSRKSMRQIAEAVIISQDM